MYLLPSQKARAHEFTLDGLGIHVEAEDIVHSGKRPCAQSNFPFMMNIL